MKRSVPLALLLSFLAAPARADEERPLGAYAPPAPNTGVQLALRAGWSHPFGSVSGAHGDEMTNAFSDQVQVLADLGTKIGPRVFLGAYLGFGVGGPAGQTADFCSSANISCVATMFRFGAEVQYHFMPAHWTDPWIGYGVGGEWTGLSASNGSRSVSATLFGPEFGHFLAGVDVRASHGFGVGPFVDMSIGGYTSETLKHDGTTTVGSVSTPATHAWFVLGMRVVAWP